MIFSRLSLLLLFYILAPFHVNGNVLFEQNYAPLWGQENIRILDQNKGVQLTLDQHSGSGFQSLQNYGSGWFSMRIKLPKKDSTAVITTFYLISDGGYTRDEVDFEFLGGPGGNNKDRPYFLHTNVFTKGQGAREQQFVLWFDPTTEFHNYTLLWNQKQLVFFVDETPIRVFKNIEGAKSYPTKPMKVTSTIWTGSWASNGIPINWNHAPFEAKYQGFNINGCDVTNTINKDCSSSNLWWNSELYWDLNFLQRQAYNNVRTKYLSYDYCTKQLESPECQINFDQ